MRRRNDTLLLAGYKVGIRGEGALSEASAPALLDGIFTGGLPERDMLGSHGLYTGPAVQERLTAKEQQMQELRGTVSFVEDLGDTPNPEQEVEAVLTRSHPSTVRGVPVVIVAGKATGAKELAGTMVLNETPADEEAESLVRTARMNGYRVESPR